MLCVSVSVSVNENSILLWIKGFTNGNKTEARGENINIDVWSETEYTWCWFVNVSNAFHLISDEKSAFF